MCYIAFVLVLTVVFRWLEGKGFWLADACCYDVLNNNTNNQKIQAQNHDRGREM